MWATRFSVLEAVVTWVLLFSPLAEDALVLEATAAKAGLGRWATRFFPPPSPWLRPCSLELDRKPDVEDWTEAKNRASKSHAQPPHPPHPPPTPCGTKWKFWTNVMSPKTIYHYGIWQTVLSVEEQDQKGEGGRGKGSGMWVLSAHIVI